MFCRTPTPVDVVIGDPHNPEPGAVICGKCSAAIDAQVAAVMAAPVTGPIVTQPGGGHEGGR
jgi:hypothetical protein